MCSKNVYHCFFSCCHFHPLNYKTNLSVFSKHYVFVYAAGIWRHAFRDVQATPIFQQLFQYCGFIILNQGRIKGGGGGGGGSISCRPKGSPCELFSDIQFWLTDPKIFLKAPLALMYTHFKGRARAKKKRNFFVKVFQEVPKNAFFGFFQNFACGTEFLIIIGTL